MHYFKKRRKGKVYGFKISPQRIFSALETIEFPAATFRATFTKCFVAPVYRKMNEKLICAWDLICVCDRLSPSRWSSFFVTNAHHFLLASFLLCQCWLCLGKDCYCEEDQYLLPLRSEIRLFTGDSEFPYNKQNVRAVPRTKNGARMWAVLVTAVLGT